MHRLILILVLLCSGCATAQPPAAKRPVSGTTTVAASGPQAEITFCWPPNGVPGRKVRLVVDGKEVVVMRAGRYTVFKLKPGKHTFYACASGFLEINAPHPTISAELAAGHYFLHYSSLPADFLVVPVGVTMIAIQTDEAKSHLTFVSEDMVLGNLRRAQYEPPRM